MKQGLDEIRERYADDSFTSNELAKLSYSNITQMWLDCQQLLKLVDQLDAVICEDMPEDISMADYFMALDENARLTVENEKIWTHLHAKLENEKRLAESDEAIWREEKKSNGSTKPQKCHISILKYGILSPFMAVKTRCSGELNYEQAYCYDSREIGYMKTDEEYVSDLEKLAGNDIIEYIEVDPSATSFIQCLRRRGHTVKVGRRRDDIVHPIQLAHESTQ